MKTNLLLFLFLFMFTYYYIKRLFTPVKNDKISNNSPIIPQWIYNIPKTNKLNKNNKINKWILELVKSLRGTLRNPATFGDAYMLTSSSLSVKGTRGSTRTIIKTEAKNWLAINQVNIYNSIQKILTKFAIKVVRFPLTSFICKHFNTRRVINFYRYHAQNFWCKLS